MLLFVCCSLRTACWKLASRNKSQTLTHFQDSSVGHIAFRAFLRLSDLRTDGCESTQNYGRLTIAPPSRVEVDKCIAHCGADSIRNRMHGPIASGASKAERDPAAFDLAAIHFLPILCCRFICCRFSGFRLGGGVNWIPRTRRWDRNRRCVAPLALTSIR